MIYAMRFFRLSTLFGPKTQFLKCANISFTPLTLDQNDFLSSFIISLGKELNMGFIDKVNVCFKQGIYVQLKEIADFKKLIKNKGVSKKTIVFDNFINTKSEYENNWESPAEYSWVSHFF